MKILAGSFLYDKNDDCVSLVERIIDNKIKDIRINCSNFEEYKIIDYVNILRKIFSKFNYPINIYLDISFPGKKFRFNLNSDMLYFEKNKIYTLSYSGDNFNTDFHINNIIFFKNVNIDEEIYIDDGKYTFLVSEIKDKIIYLKSFSSGKILNGKSIYNKSCIFEKINYDNKLLINNLNYLLKQVKPEYLILSFCEDVNDIIFIQNILKNLNLKTQIVPKIETKYSIENLEELFSQANTFMLGRGDLGITLDNVLQLGFWQKSFINKCKSQNKAIIIATDILNSISEGYYIPNRAEIIDLYNLIYENVDFIFCSAKITNSKKYLKNFANICNYMRI